LRKPYSACRLRRSRAGPGSVSPTPLCTRRLARNEIDWVPPSADETVATIERVAAGTITERELADWLRATRA